MKQRQPVVFTDTGVKYATRRIAAATTEYSDLIDLTDLKGKSFWVKTAGEAGHGGSDGTLSLWPCDSAGNKTSTYYLRDTTIPQAAGAARYAVPLLKTSGSALDVDSYWGDNLDYIKVGYQNADGAKYVDVTIELVVETKQ